MKSGNYRNRRQEDPNFEKDIIVLRKKGYSIGKISEELHAGQLSVRKIIDELIAEGRLEEEYADLKQRGKQHRNENILQLVKEKKTAKEIAKILDIPLGAVYTGINDLIEMGKVTKQDLQSNASLLLENEILELKRQGCTKTEIRERLHIGTKTLISALEKLNERGLLESENDMEANAERDPLKKAIYRMLKEGYSVKEISKVQRHALSVVYKKINELIEDGKISQEEVLHQKQRREDEIERKIKEFMKKGWNRKRISGELNMGYEELNPIVDKIIIEWDKEKKRAELFEKNDKKGEKNQSDSNTMPVRNGIVELDKKNSSESQENDGKQTDIEITNEKINRMNMLKDMIRDYRINPVIQREYYLLCIQFVKSGRKLKKEELDLLVRAVENGSINIDMDCLRFIGTEYAKLGDITPAIKLSTMCISLYGETESLLQFRKVLLDMQKKQKVLNLIKQNIPVQVITEETGESEINVLRMRREYQQANSQEQER